MCHPTSPNFAIKVKNLSKCKCTELFSLRSLNLTCMLCPHIHQTDSPRPNGSSSKFPVPLSHITTIFRLSVCLDADVHFVNMTALTGGGLRSSFWIVDRKHIYIGSADMDWRSLSKVTKHVNNRTTFWSKNRTAASPLPMHAFLKLHTLLINRLKITLAPPRNLTQSPLLPLLFSQQL